MIMRIQPGSRMSRAVVHDRTVYISGQTANNRKGSIEQQTEETLDKIDQLLHEAGTDRSHLLSIMVFLPHIADFSAMNGVYDSWIDPLNPPARACTEARLADPDLRIEITAIAALD